MDKGNGLSAQFVRLDLVTNLAQQQARVRLARTVVTVLISTVAVVFVAGGETYRVEQDLRGSLGDSVMTLSQQLRDSTSALTQARYDLRDSVAEWKREGEGCARIVDSLNDSLRVERGNHHAQEQRFKNLEARHVRVIDSLTTVANQCSVRVQYLNSALADTVKYLIRQLTDSSQKMGILESDCREKVANMAQGLKDTAERLQEQLTRNARLEGQVGTLSGSNKELERNLTKARAELEDCQKDSGNAPFRDIERVIPEIPRPERPAPEDTVRPGKRPGGS